MSKMIKVFISQPMDGDEEKVLEIREEAKQQARTVIDFILHPVEELDIVFVENYVYEDAPQDVGHLWYLGRSVQLMDTVDFVFFVKGWEDARGCQIEHQVAELYDIPIIYEKFPETKNTFIDQMATYASHCFRKEKQPSLKLNSMTKELSDKKLDYSEPETPIAGEYPRMVATNNQWTDRKFAGLLYESLNPKSESGEE